MENTLTANEGKNLEREYDGRIYERYAIKTPVVQCGDDLVQVLKTYVSPHLLEGDVLFLSEKMVSAAQGRAIKLVDIKPGLLARFLVRFVYKSAHGIGLGMAETMEMAIRECGALKILFAAFCGAIGKLFGKRGWFYTVAGDRASGIDGPCSYTLPPFNEYVSLSPENPDKVAHDLSEELGVVVLIVDINDLGGKILGASDSSLDREMYVKILADNPLGQGSQQTPAGIIRKKDAAEDGRIAQ